MKNALENGRGDQNQQNIFHYGGMCMDGQNWLELLNRQTWLQQIQEINQYTEKYGLTLSEKDTEILLAERIIHSELNKESNSDKVSCRRSSMLFAILLLYQAITISIP